MALKKHRVCDRCGEMEEIGVATPADSISEIREVSAPVDVPGPWWEARTRDLCRKCQGDLVQTIMDFWPRGVPRP